MENCETPSNDTVTDKYSILKELSKKNGEINRMNLRLLKKSIAKLHLNSNGSKEVLRKRLKQYYQKEKLISTGLYSDDTYKCELFIIIDFEATCEEQPSDDFKHEIIEFPAVLLSSKRLKKIDEFHSYVRPTLNPILSKYCTELTGITQKVIEKSPTFKEVLLNFEIWLHKHDIYNGNQKFCIVTDGPSDIGRFLVQQCKISDVPIPHWAKFWVNVKKIFGNFYGGKNLKIEDMLNNLGLDFKGTLHRGIDDARNISRIALSLLSDGASLRINEMLEEENVNGENSFKVAIATKEDHNKFLDKTEENNSNENLTFADKRTFPF